MTTLLIDSDIVAFQASSVNQTTIQWDENDPLSAVTVTGLDAAKRMIDERVGEWVHKFGATRVVMALTDSVNWRHTILPSYKMNRHGLPKPVLLKEIKEYISTEYETFLRPTLEADDVLGILATHPTLIPGAKILISEDKDMQTIPCVQFNPRKDGDVRVVEPDFAHKYHMFQTLTGDAVDGYKGCPGIGKVKALEILDCPVEFMWHAVVQAYCDKGRTEQEALVQAQVARICQHTDYNFTTKEVILWQPS